MSELAATPVASPGGAAPPAQGDATPDIPADAVAAPATKSGREKARELAAAHLNGKENRDAAPKGDKKKADGKPPKGDEAVVNDAQALVEAEAKKAAEAKAAAEEKAREDKVWKEIRRRKQQQRQFAEEQKKFQSEREADEALKKSDPGAWLEKHGFDFREVAKAAVDKHSESPEKKAAREAQSQLEAMRKELDELKSERQSKAQTEAIANLKEMTAGDWESAKSDYPTLLEFHSVEEITQAAVDLQVDFMRRFQREPAMADVFAHMEQQAKKLAEKYNKKPAEAAPLASDERATSGASAPKTRAKVGPPVTNRDSSTRASPTTLLTPAEKRERAVEKARALFSNSE